MSRASRIRSVYVKELLETLRDKRTLLAMLVLPLVLYPLMVLGFAKIRSLEDHALQDASYRVAVSDRASAALLRSVIDDYRTAVEAGSAELPGADLGGDATAAAPSFDIIVQQVEDDRIGTLADARVEFSKLGRKNPERIEQLAGDQLEARIIYRQTDVHSDAAAAYLTHAFNWQFSLRRDRAVEIIQEAVHRAHPGVDIWEALSPVSVQKTSVSSEKELSGWLFGQILPIILVVMTVSGATYPAIDLTAGERERGTLETLLVAPVPAVELITGKFLVVTTIAMVTAILNVVFMGATLQFGGVSTALGSPGTGAIPLHVFPIILLCLVPFAVLSSAVLLAVCCFARTFKEAQNYVMPVLIGSMVPAAVGLMQTMELTGVVQVTPIANLTLLTRDLFQGTWTWSSVVVVWLSTALYAGAAVAVATKLFGQEAVIFADTARLRTLLTRRWRRSDSLPSASQVLLPVAIIFPVVFYLQTGLQQHAGHDLARFMRQWGVAQVLLFVAVPLGLIWFLKLDLAGTFSLRQPRLGAWPAAVMLGLSTWVVATEVGVFQLKFVGRGLQLEGMEAAMRTMFEQLGLGQALLLVAVLPGICEEFLFRGFLLGGIRRSSGKWGTVLVVGVVFGLFHLYGFKLLVTCLLGMLLALVCWQTRSIWPGVVIHILHNATAVCLVASPGVAETLRLDVGADSAHLPPHILIPGCLIFALGLFWIVRLGPLPTMVRAARGVPPKPAVVDAL
jgi:ABC-2 type transport system permease protein/sodium transport system permease protein